jgi:glycosyltransferase involved in cell wall biosynthesis
MKVSLVIPVFNESGNIYRLEKEIRRVLTSSAIEWECIWVDDASTDDSWKEILNLEEPNVGVLLKKNSGQAIATMAGIDQAKYEFIATLDGDGQNDPSDIVGMVKLFQENPDLDLVQGFRENRIEDKKYRKPLSKIANILIQLLSRRKIIDLGCSIRLFRKQLMNELRLTGEMHRLFTLYLIENGAKSIQVGVNHRRRQVGKSKYGLSRIYKLVADLLLYHALKSIFINPLYTFAKYASLGFMASFLLIFLAIFLRLVGVKNYIDGNLVTTALLLFSTSTIFIGLGLIGEMVARVMYSSQKSYQYGIAKKHN